MMNTQFRKRIFNLRSCLNIHIEIFQELPSIISAIHKKRIDRKFTEKLMLATTSVNKCAMCARLHSELAVSSGVDKEEVMALLNMDLGKAKEANEYELTGLLFAQHYAEANRNPDPKLVKELFSFYGQEVSQDIIIFTKLMNYNNLIGNTFSAFASRLNGIKAPNSSLGFELIFVIIFSPILIPTLFFNYLKGNNISFETVQ